MDHLNSVILGTGFAAMAAALVGLAIMAAKKDKIIVTICIIAAIIFGGLSYPLIDSGWKGINKSITPTTAPKVEKIPL